MNPLGVLTAQDVATPGEVPQDAPVVAADTAVREVMERLKDSAILGVAGGGRVTRDGVIARLLNPRG
jgi:glycine betaine/proline transport system ATP-binding protein